jgi:hypothetical protein
MMSRGKDATGPAATAAEKEASDARAKAQKDAVSGNKTVEKSSSAYNPVTSNDTPGQVARNRGVGDATNDPIVKPAPKVEAKVDADDAPSTPLKQVDRTMEDATKQKVLDTLNQRAGANTPSALRSDQLADVSRAVKREEKTKKAAQGDFSGVYRSYKNRDGTPAVKAQETYDTLNKKSGANNSSAMKTDALMVASRAAKAADAKRRAAKQSSFKSGGAIKMASGGMAASRRGDGIAQRGKTRGKMC